MNAQLEIQINETMKNAFWDLLKHDLKSDPQHFDHLIILIKEIKEKIISFTPNRNDFKTELEEVLDDVFLKHMFIEKSLDPSHFFNLIIFLINKIKLYAAPYLDNEIRIWEENVNSKLQCEIIYAEFIPFYVKIDPVYLSIESAILSIYYSKNSNKLLTYYQQYKFLTLYEFLINK